MGSRASCSGPAVYTLTRAVLPAVYQKFDPDLAQWGVVSDRQNSKHMSIGMTTRIFHAESEGYISAEGDSYQSGGKRLVVHKDIAVAHGGARNRNSNRLFCVTNPDLSRRHIGGQVRKTPSWPRSWANSSLSRCVFTGMHGPTCIFWANLTPFSLQLQSGDIFRSVHRHNFSSVGEASGGRLRSNAERDRTGSTTSSRSSIWHCAAATWMLAMASLQSAPRSVAIILSGKETAA